MPQSMKRKKLITSSGSFVITSSSAILNPRVTGSMMHERTISQRCLEKKELGMTCKRELVRIKENS